tara:strand:- start:136 stop:546 length:411 start_codon:yes stop_codon:yes gene_type:complete
MNQKYKIRLNVFRENDKCTYEVMETHNIPEILPGHCWHHIDKESNILDWILDRINTYNPEANVKPEDIHIILSHPYETKTITLEGKAGGAVEIQTPKDSSFEIRHDHAGDSRYDSNQDVAEALNNISSSIDNHKDN